MSVLGPLFIPRKDHLTVPTVKDNPELEKFLTTLLQRIRTNELAIQRWANTAPRLAAVMGPSSSVSVDNSVIPPQTRLALDGPVNAYFPGIVDAANNQLTIPQSGWYTISGTVIWDTSAIVGDYDGTVEILFYKNGNVNPATDIIAASGTAGTLVSSALGLNIGIDYQSFVLTTTFAAKETIQLYGLNLVFTTGGGNTVVGVKIIAAAINFLGPTPSVVQ